MRKAGTWAVAAWTLAAAALPACGGSNECSPRCRAGFECYYGACLPASPDASPDTGGDVAPDADVRPREDVALPDIEETTPDTGCAPGVDCADEDPCTIDLCDPATGACIHPAAPDDAPCADDGDPCTQDVCQAGTCIHPVAWDCCREHAECDDGNPCTDDACTDGLCSNTSRPDCCTRDADCMWPSHIWECNAETMTCYDPPAAEPCGGCLSRRDCGDGGESSDDWCVIYDWTSRGCSKDCLDDRDCPGGYVCQAEGERPCETGEAGCFCVSRFGSCEPFDVFGRDCLGDELCRICDGCGAFVCSGGSCTAPCTAPAECPWGWTCSDAGLCVPAG